MNEPERTTAQAPKAAPAPSKPAKAAATAKADPQLEAIREEIRKSSATVTQPAPRDFVKRRGDFANRE
jgi:hypothetical protein